MVLDAIKKDLPGLIKECDKYCSLITEVKDCMVMYYDKDFNPLKEIEDPTHVMGNLKQEYENPILSGHINQTKREVHVLESIIMESEHGINLNPKRDHAFKELKSKAKTCYNSLMKGVLDKNKKMIYPGVKLKSGAIKKIYFIENDLERKELIILASAAIAYSMRSIEIARENNLGVNLISHHFRIAECYEFLGSNLAKRGYSEIIREKETFMNNDNSNSGSNIKNLSKEKKIDTAEIIYLAYKKLGQAEGMEEMKRYISSLK